MKKVLFVLTAFLMGIGFANAQQRSFHLQYQGEASVGVGIGIGTFDMTRIPVRTVHGVRLNENFFVGAGLGVDFYTSDGCGTIIPIFLNAKAYYPVTDRISLLAALDLGGGVGAGDFSSLGGFLIDPQIGCSMNIQNGHALDFTFGYYHQSLTRDGLSVNAGALGFKVAYVW